eukprot:c25326_g1_i1 orf=43-840(-)
MLGKRPHSLQRTTSKLRLMPEDNLFCLPEVEPCHDDPKPSNLAFGIARQVIGFNPVSKDIDAIRSPRSVLTNVGSGCLQIRSPRSNMEGLISCPRPWENKGSQVVGLGIVAALSTVEDETANSGTPKAWTGFAVQCVNSSTFIQQQRSLSQSQPIPISRPQSLSSPRDNRCHHQIRHSPSGNHRESFAWRSHCSQSYSNKEEQAPAFNAFLDVAMEVRESIFSAASPASSSSEHLGILPETDFLSACYFCKQHLRQGKDIYMYRC